jgi:hypothetical protein
MSISVADCSVRRSTTIKADFMFEILITGNRIYVVSLYEHQEFF